MERNRLIAIVCAIIATALVIIAGKSCADDAIKNGRKNHQENERQARPGVSYSFSEGSTSAEPTETDVFGKPVTTQAQTEEVSYDIFGKPITTAPTSEVPEPGVVITYDENGDIVSSIVPETQPYNSTVTAVSEPTEAVPAADKLTDHILSRVISSLKKYILDHPFVFTLLEMFMALWGYNIISWYRSRTAFFTLIIFFIFMFNLNFFFL